MKENSPSDPQGCIALKRDPSSRQGFQSEVRIMATQAAFTAPSEKMPIGAQQEQLRLKVGDKAMGRYGETGSTLFFIATRATNKPTLKPNTVLPTKEIDVTELKILNSQPIQIREK